MIQRNSTLNGSGPDIVCEIDFTAGRELVATWEGPGAKAILEEFKHMVDHQMTKLIVPME